MTQCNGMNCGTTTGNHSPECRAEHAAAVAGGRFVKVTPAVDAGALDEREAFEAFMQDSTSRSINRDAHGFYIDFVTYEWWKVWQARAALSASTEAAAGEPDIAQLALDWVVIARKALKAEPSAADGYYNGYHDALTAPPAATLSTETVDKPVDRLTEAVELTIETIKRQLELIEDRAPGVCLDKMPVVRSLMAHKQRLEKALNDSQGGA